MTEGPGETDLRQNFMCGSARTRMKEGYLLFTDAERELLSGDGKKEKSEWTVLCVSLCRKLSWV